MLDTQARHALYDMLGHRVPLRVIVHPNHAPFYRSFRRILVLPDTKLATLVEGAALVLGGDRLEPEQQQRLRENLRARLTDCL